jgi:hypothetical protein
MDAEAVAICEIKWTDNSLTAPPLVSVFMTESKNFPADPKVQTVINKHSEILDELSKSVICKLPCHDGNLSSCKVRQEPSSMATFLASICRDTLQTDCAMMNAGHIRANKTYTDVEFFTYTDLKEEVRYIYPVMFDLTYSCS